MSTPSASPLRVIFTSPYSSPTPQFSLCTTSSSISCGSAVTPPVTSLGNGQWAADVSLPSAPQGGQAAGGANAGAGQWVLRMQTDQGVVYSSPFAVGAQGANAPVAIDAASPSGSDAATAAASVALTASAASTASAQPTPVQALQTLIMTGTPLPLSATPSVTSTGTTTTTCSSTSCPSATPSSDASAFSQSPIALPLALALCLPIVLAMCLFLLHFCRRRQAASGHGGGAHEDGIFPPSPPLRQIERLEALSKLPPLVTARNVGSENSLERGEKDDFHDDELDHLEYVKGAEHARYAAKDKDLPPPPPAYDSPLQRRPTLHGELERAILTLGRVLSDTALVRLPSLRSSSRPPMQEQARSEPALPAQAVLRNVQRKPVPPLMGGKRVSFSVPHPTPRLAHAEPLSYQHYQPQPVAPRATVHAASYCSSSTTRVDDTVYATPLESPSYTLPLKTPAYGLEALGEQFRAEREIEHERQEGYFYPAAAPAPFLPVVAAPSRAPTPAAPITMTRATPPPWSRPPSTTPVYHTPYSAPPGPPPAPPALSANPVYAPCSGQRKTPALPEIRSPTPIDMAQLQHQNQHHYVPSTQPVQPVRHACQHHVPLPASDLVRQPDTACGCSSHGTAPTGMEQARHVPPEQRYPVEPVERYSPPGVGGCSAHHSQPQPQQPQLAQSHPSAYQAQPAYQPHPPVRTLTPLSRPTSGIQYAPGAGAHNGCACPAHSYSQEPMGVSEHGGMYGPRRLT